MMMNQSHVDEIDELIAAFKNAYAAVIKLGIEKLRYAPSQTTPGAIEAFKSAYALYFLRQNHPSRAHARHLLETLDVLISDKALSTRTKHFKEFKKAIDHLKTFCY